MYSYTYISLFICILYLLVNVSSYQQPKITKRILPEVKRVGTTGYLNCTVTRQGIYVVNWIHQDINNPTIISSNNKIEISDVINGALQDGDWKYSILMKRKGETTTYTLVIRRLEFNDAGIYKCKIVMSGHDIPTSEHPSKDGKLIVLLPPKINPAQTTQILKMKINESSFLDCAADGFPKPKIMWVRANGKTLPPPYNTFKYKGNRLELKRITKDGRGVYRCIADNTVKPPATYDVQVYVQFAPSARAVQSSYGQASNRNFRITLECVISGYPAPVLNWYKLNDEGIPKVITDTDEYDIDVLLSHGQSLSAYQVWYQLTLINVQADKIGTYRCEGINAHGSHYANVELYSTNECQGANCPPDSYRHVGNDVTAIAASFFTIIISFCSTRF